MAVETITLPNGNPVRLGRVRPKALPQALKFRTYLSAGATPPPAGVDYAAKAQAALSRMYLNNQFGDCVIAAAGHEVGIWSGNDPDSGGVVQATDQEIYSQYQGICGPGDNGCVITDVLDVMKSKGLMAGGKSYRIDGYVAIDWTNKLEVQIALYLFGTLNLGINLPQAWTTADVWDVTNTPIVGGHCVTCTGYNSQGVQISSWGRVFTITWTAFLGKLWVVYFYFLLSPLWYGNDKLAPCGVDAATLKADLDKLSGGTIPPIDPPPVPPPPPPIPPPVSGPPLSAVIACDRDVSARLARAFGNNPRLIPTLKQAETMLEAEHTKLYQHTATAELSVLPAVGIEPGSLTEG